MTDAARLIDEDPFPLVAAGDTFVVRIDPHLCTGPRERVFMFGGAGIALATRAIEHCTGEALRWLTLQFVAPTPRAALLELTLDRGGGDRLVQLSVTGRVDGKTVVHGIAAAGGREGTPERQAATPPAAPPPESCPVIRAHNEAEHDVHQLLEIRLVQGRFGIFSKADVSADGHVRVWMRPTRGPLDAAILGLMADFIPSTSSNAFAARAGGSSLDNTVRIVRIVPTRWVLCDFAIPAVSAGIGHGTVELYAEDGTLMALAGQSFIPRLLPARAGAAR